MEEEQIQEDKKEENKKINRHEFYFELPLYKYVELGDLEEDILHGNVDAYNSESHYDTTYEIDADHLGHHYSDFKSFYAITLTCKRNDKDTLRFFVYYYKGDNRGGCMKLGQLPTLADIQFAEIGKKYDKLLGEYDLQGFKKAIEGAAHGFGAGSFVYLRRIFENLIKDTFINNKATLGIDEKEFLNKRMVEKVDFLKNYLPSQLIEMKSIYGILSTGVHELTEQECLTYFPALKLSIELILDQKIENEIKRVKDDAVKKQIQDITHQLNNKA